MNEKKQGIYLYCIGHWEPLKTLKGKGLDKNTPMRVEKMEQLAAVYSRVPLDPFVDEEKMKDIDWIGPKALEHERVIEWVMKHGSVFPLRFATLFTSLESLKRRFSPHILTLEEFLKRVETKNEWSLKAMFARETLRRYLLAENFREKKKSLENLSPGKRYFEKQRLEKELEHALSPWLKKNCQKFLQEIAEHFPDYVQREVLSGQVTGSDDEMIFNLAFLVEKGSEDKMRNLVNRANDEYSRKGISYSLTGPWPPFSFCPNLES